MELNLVGANSEKLTLKDEIFSCGYNGPLIHQVVTAYLSASRTGNHAQKTRSEVRGGGIKPFRQKGTGRARAGTIRSPIWRKGGVVFAAKPRSYAQKVNRKMYRGALRSVFSELIRNERLVVVKDLEVDSCKTRELLKILSPFMSDKNTTLVLTDAVSHNLYLSSRNVANLDVRDTSAIDPVCLVHAEKVVVTISAMKQIEEMLA